MPSKIGSLFDDSPRGLRLSNFEASKPNISAAATAVLVCPQNECTFARASSPRNSSNVIGQIDTLRLTNVKENEFPKSMFFCSMLSTLIYTLLGLFSAVENVPRFVFLSKFGFLNPETHFVVFGFQFGCVFTCGGRRRGIVEFRDKIYSVNIDSYHCNPDRNCNRKRDVRYANGEYNGGSCGYAKL